MSDVDMESISESLSSPESEDEKFVKYKKYLKKIEIIKK